MKQKSWLVLGSGDSWGRIDFGLLCLSNIGALIIRREFGVYSTMIIVRNPQKPILIIKAPTLLMSLETERWED